MQGLLIGVAIIALLIAAELSKWLPDEWRKYKARQKRQAAKPIRYPMYGPDGKYR